MSASFRRKGRRDDTFGLKGTKPWTGGITQTSVGLRDLDTILGVGSHWAHVYWWKRIDGLVIWRHASSSTGVLR
jgi:hypothetical protein